MIWVRAQGGSLVNLANVTSLGIADNAGSSSVVAFNVAGHADDYFILYQGDTSSCLKLMEQLGAHLSVEARLLRIDEKGELR